MSPFHLDQEKGLEVLIYVAGRMPQGDLYKTLKAIYVADKKHLERYGRFIYGERYYAMPYGPVPQEAYDLTKVAKGAMETCALDLEDVRRGVNVSANGDRIKTQRDPQIDLLSQSEMECLDEAIRTIAPLSFNQVKQLTHDAAYKRVSPDGSPPTSAEMPIDAIIDALPKEVRKSLREHVADPFPG